MTCLNIIIHKCSGGRGSREIQRLFGVVNQTQINIPTRFCEEEFVCKKFISITTSSVSLLAPRPWPRPADSDSKLSVVIVLLRNALCMNFLLIFLFNLINNHGERHVLAVTRPGQGHPNCGERDINIVKIHIDNVSSPGTHYPVMIG